jgi:hypothetical protein
VRVTITSFLAEIVQHRITLRMQNNPRHRSPKANLGHLTSQFGPPHVSYSFKHAPVSDAAYGTLLCRKRRRAPATTATSRHPRLDVGYHALIPTIGCGCPKANNC